MLGVLASPAAYGQAGKETAPPLRGEGRLYNLNADNALSRCSFIVLTA